MAFEKKNGDLAVFKNTKKEKDTQPDYTISGQGLDGLPIKGALWLKKDRNGNTFMAGRIEVDQYLLDKQGGDFRSEGSQGVARGGGSSGHSQQERGGHRQDSYDLNDDIPFARQAFDWEI